MNINIENHSSFFRFSRRRKDSIINCIHYILKKDKKKSNRLFYNFIRTVSIKDIQINFLFIDDKEMIKYNYQYFNKKKPTDVIAFSMIEGKSIKNNSVLGDVVISVETAKRNAVLYKHSIEKEILLYVIHGILHLMGYEHTSDNSLMRKKEKQYFKERGCYVL